MLSDQILTVRTNKGDNKAFLLKKIHSQHIHFKKHTNTLKKIIYIHTHTLIHTHPTIDFIAVYTLTFANIKLDYFE